MNGKLRNMTAIYLTRGDRILLLYRKSGRVVSETWVGAAGGHFEPDEVNDARACVLRELREEIGLGEEDLARLTYRYIALRNVGDELRENHYFFAELKDSVPDDLTSNEGELRWFALEEVSALNMPISAKIMLEHYLREGRNTDLLYAVLARPDAPQVVPLEVI